MSDSTTIFERALAESEEGAELYAMGFSGGTGGDFVILPPAQGSWRLHEIVVWAGSKIDAVQLEFKHSNGSKRMLDKVGGDGGTRRSITFSDGEYVRGINGAYGGVVRTLEVVTNKRRRHFGDRAQEQAGGRVPYSFEAPKDLEINGMFFRAGRFIDSIAVYMQLR